MNLYINGQRADFSDDDRGPSMTVANPALTPDKLARTVSYSFSLPATPHNLRLLPAANRLDRKEFDYGYPAQLRASSGAVLHDGEVVILARSKQRISVVFRDEAPALIARLDKLRLRNLPDVVNIPQTQLPGYNLTLQLFVPSYEIEIDSHLFTQTGGDRLASGLALRQQINDYFGLELAKFDQVNYILAVWPVPLSEGLYNGTGWVNEASFVGFDITTPADYWPGVVASAENFFNWLEPQYATPRDDMAWPMVLHESFYPDNTEYFGLTNHAKDGVATKRGYTHTSHPSHPYVPYFRAKWLLLRLVQEAGGAALAGDFMGEPEGAQLLVWNPREMALLTVNEVGDYGSGWGIFYNEKITVANHVPDLGALELLKAITEAFNLSATVRGGTVYFVRNKALLERQPVDWSEWVEPDYEIEDADDRGYRLQWKADDKEQLTSADYGGVTVDEGARTTDLLGQPLAEQQNVVDRYESPSERLRAAWTKRPGSSEAFDPKTIQEFALRFMWERGLQDNDVAKEYWQSGNGTLNYLGDEVGDTDLKLPGTNGLAATNHGKWPGLEDRPVVRLAATIPVGELQRALRWDNPMIRFIHPMGSVRAMIKEIRYNADEEANGWVRVAVDAVIV